MKKPLSKWGLVLSGGYLGLVGWALFYIWWAITYHRGTSELCGVPLLLLGGPWTLMASFPLAALRKLFPPLAHPFTFWVLMAGSIVLNTRLAYLFGRLLEPKKS